MVGHGGSSAGSYLADPTSPIPSHCASVIATSTLRVKVTKISLHYTYICYYISRDTQRNKGIRALFNIAQFEGLGRVDRALDSRSKGLGFDSHCWLCVEVIGKLIIPYCLSLSLPSSDGCQVEQES